MTEQPVPGKRPPISPERAARNGRRALLICFVFFLGAAAALGAYAWHSHQDWTARTSPPGGRTTEAVIEHVTQGRNCAGSNCSDEWELAYSVDGVEHTTTVRIHLHAGQTVHAFKGSNGHWYVTEDPGFGNSRVAWVLWAVFGAASLGFALFCLRGWRRIPKPGAPEAPPGVQIL